MGRAQGVAVVVVELRAAGPVRLGEVQEGEVAATELAGDVQPGLGALGVLGPVERADRGDPDGDAVGDQASMMASVTSSIKRVRLASGPPYSSVRRLLSAARNWCSR